MKKIFTILAVVFITTSAFSQIKQVKDVKPTTIGKIGSFGKISIDCTKLGDEYTFTYNNIKFQHIDDYKSFSFKDKDDAFNSLYEIIMKGLKDPPKEDIKLKLPNDIVYLHFIKSFGVANFQFIHHVNKSNVIGVSCWLTKKKVMRLFGKKKKKRRK